MHRNEVLYSYVALFDFMHIWRVFHLRLRLITFGGRSAQLAYHVHKSGRCKNQSIDLTLCNYMIQGMHAKLYALLIINTVLYSNPPQKANEVLV